MPTIVIRIDPRLLEDPDLDLRYEIPDLLVARTGGALSDQGYDYEIEGEITGHEAMQIYLGSASPESVLPVIVEVLGNARLHGNDLLAAATIGVSDEPPDRADSFRVVHPPGSRDVISIPRGSRPQGGTNER